MHFKHLHLRFPIYGFCPKTLYMSDDDNIHFFFFFFFFSDCYTFQHFFFFFFFVFLLFFLKFCVCVLQQQKCYLYTRWCALRGTFIYCKYLQVMSATWQNQQNECAPSEDSGQPGHQPSLIRVFAVSMKKSWVLSYPLSAQRRLWSDWAGAQLIWVFAGRTLILLVLSCRGSYKLCCE